MIKLTRSKGHGALPAVSRRAVLGGSMASLVTAGTASADIPGWLTQAGLPVRAYGTPATDDIVRVPIQPHGLAPEYGFSGTPLHRLRGTITPSGLHFEVHHGGRPEIDASQHELFIHGLVDKPLRLDLAALERYPMVTRTHFIECAGNSFFISLRDEPVQRSIDFLHGLLSNSEWTGVPLRVLMEEAGVQPEGRWLVAMGNDAPNLSRSIPMEKVMRDGMLALYQNGEPIRPEQGYPMRILLPGYEGNMNIKWVASLQVTDRPVNTADESGSYTDVLADGSVLMHSVTMPVKSLITHPSATMTMSGAGWYEVSGLAWSGMGKITRVEVSADGGASWLDAELTAPVLDRAVTRFSLPWVWDGAPAKLMSRAIDETGAIQPTRSEWKTRYAPGHLNHYNGIQVWNVTADGEVQNAYS